MCIRDRLLGVQGGYGTARSKGGVISPDLAGASCSTAVLQADFPQVFFLGAGASLATVLLLSLIHICFR